MKNHRGLLTVLPLWAVVVGCGLFGSKTSDQAVNSSVPNTASAGPSVTKSPPAARFRKPDFTVDPVALHDAYDKDDRSVDKYKDKIVEIMGRYKRSVGSNSYLSVVIDSGKNREVWCRMADGMAIAVSQLKEGENIKLTGVGDPYVSALGPGFKDCQPQP